MADPTIRWRVIIKGNSGGSAVWNSLVFIGDAAAIPTPDLVANKIVASWLTPIRPHISQQFLWVEVEVQDRDPGIQPTFRLALANFTGQNGAALLPSQVAWLFRLTGPEKGRSKRGRMYQGGATIASCSGGILHPSAVTTLDAIGDVWRQNFCEEGHANYTGLRLHTQSRKLGSLHAVTQIKVDSVFGIIRKRRLGTGI